MSTKWELSTYWSKYPRQEIKKEFIPNHPSGFFADYIELTGDNDEKVKHLSSMSLEDGDKVLDVNGFSHVGNDWYEIFKQDIEEFKKAFFDEEIFNAIMSGQVNISDFHFGIWDFDKECASSCREYENAEKYRNWRFVILEFPEVADWNRFEKEYTSIHFYPNHWYSETPNQVVILFQELKIETLKKIFTLRHNLYEIAREYNKTIRELEEKYRKESSIDEKIVKLLKEGI